MAELIPTKELIAYLEGEMAEAKARELEARLMQDDDLQRELEKLRSTRNALCAAFDVAPNRRFSEKVVGRIVAKQQARMWWRPMAAVAFGSLAVLAAVMFMPSDPEPSTSDYILARGSSATSDKPERKVGITAYLHHQSNPMEKVRVREGMQFAGDDGFSFVLHNRSGNATYLMLFGLDASGELHWFYPAVEHDARDLSSVKVSATPTMRPLPDGVTPGILPSGPFKIIALFTEQPKKNGEIANLLEDGDPNALKKRFPDAVLQVITVNGGGE